MEYYLAQTTNDFNYIASLFNPKNSKYLFKKKMKGNDIKKSHKNNSDIKTFILINKNKKIGWFTITKFKNRKEGDFGMIIDKPYQKNGYGFKAINYIEREAKKSGINKLTLQVFEKNEPAIYIYKKANFKERCRLIKMEKKIK